jgi:hypothetical protein
MSFNIGDRALLGQVYTGCTTAAGLCTGLSTTYTGLCIYNPFGSGTNFLVYDFAAAASVVPGAVSELMISVSSAISQTAPATNTSAGLIQAAKVGSGAGLSKAQLFTITTLPVVNVNYRVVPGSITTGAVNAPTYYAKIDGSLIVVPGTGVMVSFTTTALTAQYSFTWAEVPAF